MNAESETKLIPENQSEKKCTSCGKWTRWSRQQDDVCEHCGAELSTHLKEKEARAERMKSYPKGLFPVKEHDAVLIKMGKYSINTIHVIFTAIVSFIVWFITFVVT